MHACLHASVLSVCVCAYGHVVVEKYLNEFSKIILHMKIVQCIKLNCWKCYYNKEGDVKLI